MTHREHLAEADRFIAECKDRIARQRKIIATAYENGHPTVLPVSLLRVLEENLRSFEKYRLLILDQQKKHGPDDRQESHQEHMAQDDPEKLARKAVRPRLRHRQRKAQSLTHKVGYIGCSNSQDTVDGYHLSPGNRNYLWPSYDTGGGSIDKWADASSLYWTSYSAMLTKYGQPKYVWVQLCERAYQGAFNTYDQVKIMIGNLKRKSPNAAVIVSGINDYSPNPRLCDLMGTASASSPGNGVYDTKLWADQLVADKLVRIRGPYLGPLTSQLTLNDGCHPNSAGRLLLGNQLRKVIDVLR